jgi:hypothetical protein
METNRTPSPDASSTDAAVFSKPPAHSEPGHWPREQCAESAPDGRGPYETSTFVGTPPAALPTGSTGSGRPDPSSASEVPPEPRQRIGWIDGHLPDLVEPLTPAEPENAFTETRRLRHDGWTPQKKRLFLERFAECGVIVEACEAAGMSARAAYNLRDRDPLFAAGWDAAGVKARAPLADEAYSRARNGVVERIYKDGMVVAERHRYDNRLTMAVLTRLDARIDRAEEKGAAHLAVAARWDEYLAALADDRQEDGMALLQPPEPARAPAPAAALAGNARHRELHELHWPSDEELDAVEPADRHEVWESEGVWYTDFPPPAGFDGEEHLSYGRYGYRRTLSPDEQAVIDADRAADVAEAAAKRDAYFGFDEETEGEEDGFDGGDGEGDDTPPGSA